MRAAKTRTLDTDATPEAAFSAVRAVVDGGKYELVGDNTETHRIAFLSGKTAISWGQEYAVEVTPRGGGATITVLCGSHDDAPKALLDGWKGGKAADKFLAQVQHHLAG